MGQEKNDHETVGGAHGSGEGTHESVAGHCEYVKGHHGSVRRTRLHTFVVCAYKESPYLRECIRSLCDQTVRSRIVISTSTPNASIRGIAEEYGLKIAVNERGMGIADDWNYALQQANTPLVTLAHQDDVYESNYTQRVLKAFRKDRNAIIFFTDYWERRRCSR